MPQDQRILILSDTHGFLDPRIAVLAEDCDVAVHAGDVGAASVLEQLRHAARQLIVVRGNNDTPRKWPDSEQDREPWMLNPGAAGRVRTYGGPSCLWLVASMKSWRVEEVRFSLRR